MTRRFLRLPVFDSVEDAIEWCAERGYKVPILHPAQSAPVVGITELDANGGESGGKE